MEIHSGTFHCPGMDLAGTRDILSHSGTVPGNPGQLVTLDTSCLPATIGSFDGSQSSPPTARTKQQVQLFGVQCSLKRDKVFR